MKRRIKIFFVLSVLLAGSLPAQENPFTLSGKVFDCKSKQPVEKLIIKVVGSDGSSIQTETDSSGMYFFDNKKLNKNRQYVAFTIIGSGVTRYFSSTLKFKFNTYDTVSQKSIKADFCLDKNPGCLYGPVSLYFKKNSPTEFYGEDSLKDAIDRNAYMLLDNPTLVIEIGGHAGTDEKHPDQLAMARATYIRELLIRKGIEPGRLIIKNYSDERPYPVQDEMGKVIKEIKKGEKAQRVTFYILRKDYVPAKPATEPVLQKERSEEE
jgi:outer membrane protein OmpA-like peptidoglycan-associated protein